MLAIVSLLQVNVVEYAFNQLEALWIYAFIVCGEQCTTVATTAM
jgi:hypothetical protein